MAACEQCGAAVAPQGKRFCSTTCWYAYTKARRTVPCEVCKQPFERKYKTQKACSVECGNKLKRTDRDVVCKACGETFERPHGKTQEYCSRSCAQRGRIRTGQQAYPEGATTLHTSGYILEKQDGEWVMQHRLVMERFLGRKLLPNERVHHRNGKRDDNRKQNLEVWTIRGNGKKDPAGIRVRDALESVLEHPVLSKFTDAQRTKVRTALEEVFL